MRPLSNCVNREFIIKLCFHGDVTAGSVCANKINHNISKGFNGGSHVNVSTKDEIFALTTYATIGK
jgi:hypothetical protein